MPPAAAGVCAELVCVGYAVISSDCNVGAVQMNGVVVRAPELGYFVFGEVFWQYCGQGASASGHSIEAFSQGWYDMTDQGARTCGVYTAFARVDTDCALGPPHLPILVQASGGSRPSRPPHHEAPALDRGVQEAGGVQTVEMIVERLPRDA